MGALAALKNLPSRGTLVTVQPGSLFAAPPVAYVADHDTAPPEDQVIKTDPTSILIRALQNRKAKEEAKKVQSKSKQADKGKRPMEDAGAGRAAKRPASDGAGPSNAGPRGGASASGAAPAAGPGPSEATYTRMSLQAKTIKDLQNVLRAWGLPISGKKEDLVTRILDRQAASRGGSAAG